MPGQVPKQWVRWATPCFHVWKHPLLFCYILSILHIWLFASNENKDVQYITVTLSTTSKTGTLPSLTQNLIFHISCLWRLICYLWENKHTKLLRTYKSNYQIWEVACVWSMCSPTKTVQVQLGFVCTDSKLGTDTEEHWVNVKTCPDPITSSRSPVTAVPGCL